MFCGQIFLAHGLGEYIVVTSVTFNKSDGLNKLVILMTLKAMSINLKFCMELIFDAVVDYDIRFIIQKVMTFLMMGYAV